jgi:hypothetical protein
MENIKESVIPVNIWEEDPEYAQELQNIHDYLKRTPFSKAFPNKYKAITKREVLEKTYKLFKENPNMPLKNVVTTALNNLDEGLSEELVLDMTRIIIKEWKELTASTYADKQVEELV